MNLRASVGLIILCAGLAINAFSEQTKPAKAAENTQSGPTQGPEYRLGAEDVIESFVYKEPELTATAVVRPDGKISLPLVGEIEATGKTVRDLQSEVTSKLVEFIEDPVVTIILKEINSPKISVFGEVNKSAVFPIKQKMTVLEAIALAGGFTVFAKRDHVNVIRTGASGQQERIKLNLERLLKDGTLFYLQASDVVWVE